MNREFMEKDIQIAYKYKIILIFTLKRNTNWNYTDTIRHPWDWQKFQSLIALTWGKSELGKKQVLVVGVQNPPIGRGIWQYLTK